MLHTTRCISPAPNSQYITSLENKMYMSYESYNASYAPVSMSSSTSTPNITVYKKTKWTPEEDTNLIASVKRNGMGNWSMVAESVPGRTGKQCRERWTNQLCPSLNKDNWTAQEDQILIKQQQIHGNLWAKISQFLPGRSSNAVKNRWSWLSRHNVQLSVSPQSAPRNQAHPMPKINSIISNETPQAFSEPAYMPQHTSLESLIDIQTYADTDRYSLPLPDLEFPEFSSVCFESGPSEFWGEV